MLKMIAEISKSPIVQDRTLAPKSGYPLEPLLTESLIFSNLNSAKKDGPFNAQCNDQWSMIHAMLNAMIHDPCNDP